MERKASIMRRWVFNSIGIIFALLVVFGTAFVISFRSYYYKSAEYSLSSRIDSVGPILDQLISSSTTNLNLGSLAIELVQNFEDKEKLEMQVLSSNGEVIVSSMGFAPDKSVKPDYTKALQADDFRGLWTGKNKAGERIMSMTLALHNSDGAAFCGIRYITSLAQIDRQIWVFLGLIVLIGTAILFFVMMSSSYFISSIVRPVSEINQAARQIALGDYDSRIEKKTNDEIGQLCDTINYMAGEISAAEKVKNDFISSVSHELRTPLTAIKGWAETIRESGPKDVEMTEKGIEVITSEVERLTSIVEELLDFSRMQGGHMVMKFERVDVSAELGEAVVLFRSRAMREGLELIYIEPEVLPPVLGDPDRLKQVFINVVDNAIKYSNRDGRIRIETADMVGHVQIVISDTGVGISKQDLPNIKKRFYKANKSQPGSGIGLALADEIIRRHKGRLEIDSEEAVGTTVTITLPVAPPESRMPSVL
ncbi:MAG: HAMP domain-containing sensor histidine kinase [Oscillospiraceae bacterium]|nr:HAMP domain-containing sensor histidine kinase [Oscillospiraceae bacterium]